MKKLLTITIAIILMAPYESAHCASGTGHVPQQGYALRPMASIEQFEQIRRGLDSPLDYEEIEKFLCQVQYRDNDELLTSATRDDVISRGANIEKVLYIQNNRSGECSGTCPHCYRQVGKGPHRLIDPMPLAEIERIIHKSFEFNIRVISLNGEDSFDDWESLITIANACVSGKEKLPYSFNYAFHIFTNGFSVINNLDDAERKFQELKNTGVDFRLCFSWDMNKVRLLSRQNYCSEDEVITTMAKIIIVFRKVFPNNELLISDMYKRTRNKENREFLQRLWDRFKQLSSSEQYQGWGEWYTKLTKYELDNAKVDKGINRREKFKRLFKQLVKKAKSREFDCKYQPFIDMATSTVSNCQIYSNNFGRKISADNFAETILAPLSHPLGRHLYFGSQIERGLSKCRELLFASSIDPEDCTKPYHFEGIETKLMNDRVFRTKVGIFFLLRDILLNYNYNRGDRTLPIGGYLQSFPKELIPALVDDEILTGYLRYEDDIRIGKLMKDEYVEHGFFSFYYVWRDYKRGEIEDGSELLRRVQNICRLYHFDKDLLRNIQKKAAVIGGKFGPDIDMNKLKDFFDELSIIDVCDILRQVLLGQILLDYHPDVENEIQNIVPASSSMMPTTGAIKALNAIINAAA